MMLLRSLSAGQQVLEANGTPAYSGLLLTDSMYHVQLIQGCKSAGDSVQLVLAALERESCHDVLSGAAGSNRVQLALPH